jgi:hypothetical protein
MIKTTHQSRRKMPEDILPATTEIQRIKHTIEILKKSELYLREKILKKNPEGYSEAINKENYQHAAEIAAGWEQLARMIGELPDCFMDKALFAKEAENGLTRSSELIKAAWNQKINQR